MTEIVKLLCCLVLVYFDEGSVNKSFEKIYDLFFNDPQDLLKMMVPSFSFVLLNNLIYVSATHLNATTYQIAFQLRILPTAVFAVIMLKKKLSAHQWFSLVTLIVGVVLTQLAKDREAVKKIHHEQNKLVGFAAISGACLTSGFASVFFEMVLKTSKLSIWLRNIQLSVLSLPFSLASCFAIDGEKIAKNGFFFGYDLFVVCLIFMNAFSGLIVAVVIKYAEITIFKIKNFLE